MPWKISISLSEELYDRILNNVDKANRAGIRTRIDNDDVQHAEIERYIKTLLLLEFNRKQYGDDLKVIYQLQKELKQKDFQ